MSLRRILLFSCNVSTERILNTEGIAKMSYPGDAILVLLSTGISVLLLPLVGDSFMVKKWPALVLLPAGDCY